MVNVCNSFDVNIAYSIQSRLVSENCLIRFYYCIIRDLYRISVSWVNYFHNISTILTLINSYTRNRGAHTHIFIPLWVREKYRVSHNYIYLSLCILFRSANLMIIGRLKQPSSHLPIYLYVWLICFWYLFVNPVSSSNILPIAFYSVLLVEFNGELEEFKLATQIIGSSSRDQKLTECWNNSVNW